MAESPSYDVFISYSNEDRDWAKALADSLRSAGVRTWFDVSDVAPGDVWQERLEAALRNSKALVVVLSSSSPENTSGMFELGAALADHKRIIPLAKEEVLPDRIPLLLRRYRFLHESSPEAAGRRLAEVIEAQGDAED